MAIRLCSSSFLTERINSFDDGELLNRQKAAELELFNMGVTFSLYEKSDNKKEPNSTTSKVKK